MGSLTLMFFATKPIKKTNSTWLLFHPPSPDHSTTISCHHKYLISSLCTRYLFRLHYILFIHYICPAPIIHYICVKSITWDEYVPNCPSGMDTKQTHSKRCSFP